MVQHPDNQIIIYLCAENGPSWKISGFPQSPAWFEKQQGLDRYFGSSDHDAPGQINCLGYVCQSKLSPHKRKASGSNASLAKHVRL